MNRIAPFRVLAMALVAASVNADAKPFAPFVGLICNGRWSSCRNRQAAMSIQVASR